MFVPGPHNLLTDVTGMRVGNADDARVRTGVTVIYPVKPCLAAVDVRGGAPGTRETDSLRPTCGVDRIDAIVLAGGSVFGLDAASAVTSYLAAHERGWPVHGMRAPIVPSAILFDLANGGDKAWGEDPPYRALGRAAVIAASAAPFPLGNVGAGFGATAGVIKGGLGSASLVDADRGWQVAALIGVNPVGSVIAPGTKSLWARALAHGDELGAEAFEAPRSVADFDLPPESRIGGNTTIGVVATNLRLDKAQAERVAIMAHDGMARAIRPVHTPLDGDTLFVLSTGVLPLPDPAPLALARLGSLAADCVSRAIGRAVIAADDLHRPSLKRFTTTAGT